MRGAGVVIEQDPARTRVRLAGEVDGSTRGLSAAALARVVARGVPVELDLAGVRFLDSAGVALLVRCWRTCTEAGVPCAVTVVSEPAERVLRLVGLAGALGVPEPAPAR